MGNHGGANNRLRPSDVNGGARPSTAARPRGSRAFTLRNWPVSWRLFAVFMLTLAMGLVFGGLRVASAADSAAQFNRVSQLASLGQQITVLMQALEDERDETCGNVTNARALQRWYDATDVAAAKVKPLTAGVGGSFPADIRAKAAAVRSAITNLGQLRDAAQTSSALAVITDYAVPINAMMALNGQIAQGADDPALTNDLQTLNSLAQEKDQVAQQRAILYNAFSKGKFANAEQPALTIAVAGQSAAATAFDATATPAQQDSFTRVVAGPQVKQAVNIEQYVLSTNSLDVGTAAAAAVNIRPKNVPGQWYTAMSDTINRMQTVELGVARDLVARAQVLQRGAERAALFTGILTAAILILVLIATFALARSLVLPLRRLREGALNIAVVQLPERVQRLSGAQDPAASLEVAPIDVTSADEIGQVARAFDQVHAEAVRLAGNEALLRRSFNAMFISLSRRSQSLIERLVRMIDSLEQNEEDPRRLSNLFTMDHLVTRMRRNSENLLLLAGHEGARKWSEPVPLSDVARAAISEIEQYNRVALRIQPGVVIPGHAVSDIVHLLAELIENATVYSASDTQVLVSVQTLASGGVLIQISDSGVGISEARLAEMNQRLDDPPAIDESVSRHMGLFAVARLAERHGVRVRLRAGNPQGLTALVWLPDSLAERVTGQYGDVPQRLAAFQARRAPGQHAAGISFAADNRAVSAQPDAFAMRAGAGTSDTVRAANPATSDWFRSRRPSAAGTAEAYGGLSEAVPQPGAAWNSVTDGWTGDRQAAQIVANPVRGDRTVAGMPVRVPHANLLPGSVGGGQRVASRPADGYEPQTPAALPQRSPETTRSRLSGFQRGGRRAEGQTPHAGERTDR
jgi:signal transduction histidine kinase